MFFFDNNKVLQLFLVCCCWDLLGFEVIPPIALVVEAYSLQGKRAIVTGSSGGIGRGIALELAQQGCHVLIHYNTRAEGAHETADIIDEQQQQQHRRMDDGYNDNPIAVVVGSCAGVMQCDFRHMSDLRRFQNEIDDLWPDGYDILVNNAGMIDMLALEQDDDALSHWYNVLAVNLHAPRWLSQWAMPRMENRPEGGVILHVSSVYGESSNEYMGAYAASKAALDSLTKTMAIEYASHNVRVNAIAPGAVVVERTAQVMSNPDRQNPWLDRILAGRLGTGEDVAHAALPLLTNDWITGTIWKVDGGLTARGNMPSRRDVNSRSQF